MDRTDGSQPRLDDKPMLSSAPCILVADAIPELRRILKRSLSSRGYRVDLAHNATEAVRLASLLGPHVVLLDPLLPEAEPCSLIRRIRHICSAAIIVSSLVTSADARAAAFDAGADDFLPKPFDMHQLLAKIENLLGDRATLARGSYFQCDGLEIDEDRARVRVNGGNVRLTTAEFEVLRRLAQDAGRVVSHGQLLTEVWGRSYAGERHYLRTLIGRVRRKLGDAGPRPRFILTEPGAGYRLRTCAAH